MYLHGQQKKLSSEHCVKRKILSICLWTLIWILFSRDDRITTHVLVICHFTWLKGNILTQTQKSILLRDCSEHKHELGNNKIRRALADGTE